MLLKLLPPAVVGRRTVGVKSASSPKGTNGMARPIHLHSELKTSPTDGIHSVFPFCVGTIILEWDQR